jgi:hypothetical protein
MVVRFRHVGAIHLYSNQTLSIRVFIGSPIRTNLGAGNFKFYYANDYAR